MQCVVINALLMQTEVDYFQPDSRMIREADGDVCFKNKLFKDNHNLEKTLLTMKPSLIEGDNNKIKKFYSSTFHLH